jgi:hypothetical protein
VGEQQVFVKGHAALFGAGLDLHRQRQPGQLGIGRPARAVKGQRHQGRARLHQLQAELFGASR